MPERKRKREVNKEIKRKRNKDEGEKKEIMSVGTVTS